MTVANRDNETGEVMADVTGKCAIYEFFLSKLSQGEKTAVTEMDATVKKK